MTPPPNCLFFFFFNDTATTEIYTLSLHDALPICVAAGSEGTEPRYMLLVDPQHTPLAPLVERLLLAFDQGDRKSTRLNSSHVRISYAVFCLKKKKQPNPER